MGVVLYPGSVSDEALRQDEPLPQTVDRDGFRLVFNKPTVDDVEQPDGPDAVSSRACLMSDGPGVVRAAATGGGWLSQVVFRERRWRALHPVTPVLLCWLLPWPV